ncbi:hypothetical protein [Rhizobium sp. 12,4]|uniref:hypothetical protein n=1 Tax=Rhizobium sp. 12,4 TaxID=3405135 RepID=UPI003D34B198
MTILPPLTGTPLDYVPIDAPVGKAAPATRFRAPIIRRALIAAAALGGAAAALLFVPVATIAIIVMVGSVWGADQAVKRMQRHDET